MDVLTMAQVEHLEYSRCYFPHEPSEEFRDEAHRQRAWTLHGPQIMDEWFAQRLASYAGRRPHAFWQYEYGLEIDERRQVIWPKGIVSEAHMVHQLPDTSDVEREEIERYWLVKLRQSWRKGEAHALDWTGCPRAFYRKHVPALVREDR